MFAALDPAGNLYVTESSGLDLYEELQKQTRRCRISILTDSNRDGVYDESHVFADRLVFPMGLAWREGKLYVADPPDLITLEDTDNDGRADERKVILTGFGHTDNGSLHGLTFGPDGWLYMTMGQPDGFRIQRADGKIIEGKSGALLRCRTDGSDLEVLCRGFENLVEIVFLPTGEIIGTDNWFFLPQDGVRDALVHLVLGGVYPLNAHSRAESANFFSGELLPPLQLYPAVAHSGLMRHSGRNLPADLRGNLYSAQFNTRKIVRHQLTRHGNTFQSSDEDFLTTDNPDFHPSDVLEDHDGSILVLDTGSWYVHHCPTGRIRQTPAQGGIYRVRYTNQLPSLVEAPLDRSDAAARHARRLGHERNSQYSSELALMLSHEATHVRLAAAEALALSGTFEAVPALLDALRGKHDSMLNHSLTYALHRLATPTQLEAMLTDEHSTVRRAALIILDQPPHKKLTSSAALAAARSSDSALRQAGIAALQRHPEWQEEAFNFFSDLLAQKTITQADASTLKDWLSSISLTDRSSVAEKIDRAASDSAKDPASRALLIELLSGDGSVPSALRSALTSDAEILVTSALRSIRNSGPLRNELTTLANSDASLGTKLEAIRLLVRDSAPVSADHFQILDRALDTNNSPAHRLTAGEILSNAQLSSSSLKMFIERARNDRIISPSLVLSAAARCPAPGSAADSLITYLEQSISSGWQIPDSALQMLETKFGQNSDLLRTLHRTIKNARQDHVVQLQRFHPLLSGGDPNAGHQLFIGKLACSTCHRVGRTGGIVGPDLTKIGAIRSGKDLIESLVLPNATLAQGYETYRVTLTDGDTLTGIRVRTFDDSFILRDSSGAERRLEKSEIKTAEPHPISLMPEALLNSSPDQEIRDLLAYLQSLK